MTIEEIQNIIAERRKVICEMNSLRDGFFEKAKGKMDSIHNLLIKANLNQLKVEIPTDVSCYPYSNNNIITLFIKNKEEGKNLKPDYAAFMDFTPAPELDPKDKKDKDAQPAKSVFTKIEVSEFCKLDAIHQKAFTDALTKIFQDENELKERTLNAISEFYVYQLDLANENLHSWENLSKLV